MGVQHDARPPRLLRRRRRPGLRRRSGSAPPRRSPASTAASSLDGPQEVALTGHVVARSTPEAARLLDLVQRRPPVTASSTYGQDPQGRAAVRVRRPADDGVGLRRRRPLPDADLPVEEAANASRGSPSPPATQAPVGAVVDGERAHPAGRAHRRHRGRAQAGADPSPGGAVREGAGRRARGGAGDRSSPGRGRHPAAATRPTPTGAVCGLGPVLHIDGQEVATRVTGTMADVINGSPLALEACDEDTGDGSSRSTSGRASTGCTRRRPRSSRSSTCWRATAAPLAAPRSARSASSAGTARRAPPRSAPVRRRCSRCPRTSTTAGSPRSTARSSRRCGSTAGSRAGCCRRGSRSTVELRYRPQTTYDVILPFGLVVSGALLLGALVIALIGLVRPAARAAPGAGCAHRLAGGRGAGPRGVGRRGRRRAGAARSGRGDRAGRGSGVRPPVCCPGGRRRRRADRAVGPARRARQAGGVRDARRRRSPRSASACWPGLVLGLPRRRTPRPRITGRPA